MPQPTTNFFQILFKMFAWESQRDHSLLCLPSKNDECLFDVYDNHMQRPDFLDALLACDNDSSNVSQDIFVNGTIGMLPRVDTMTSTYQVLSPTPSPLDIISYDDVAPEVSPFSSFMPDLMKETVAPQVSPFSSYMPDLMKETVAPQVSPFSSMPDPIKETVAQIVPVKTPSPTPVTRLTPEFLDQLKDAIIAANNTPLSETKTSKNVKTAAAGVIPFNAGEFHEMVSRQLNKPEVNKLEVNKPKRSKRKHKSKEVKEGSSTKKRKKYTRSTASLASQRLKSTKKHASDLKMARKYLKSNSFKSFNSSVFLELGGKVVKREPLESMTKFTRRIMFEVIPLWFPTSCKTWVSGQELLMALRLLTGIGNYGHHLFHTQTQVWKPSSKKKKVTCTTEEKDELTLSTYSTMFTTSDNREVQVKFSTTGSRGNGRHFWIPEGPSLPPSEPTPHISFSPSEPTPQTLTFDILPPPTFTYDNAYFSMN